MSRGPQDETLFGERWPSVIHNPAPATAAIATKAAVAGKRHQVTGFTISADAAPAAAVEVTLVLGATVVERIKLPVGLVSPLVINFVPPYTALENEKAELTVPSFGGAVSAIATLRGRSIFIGSA